MARPVEAVKDINDSKDLWKIAVRCKHLWTITSASNKEHLEMILVDSKLDMIQVIVPPYLVPKFTMQLAVGCSYIMQNFKVSNNDFTFRSTKHSFKLIFCGSTSVKKNDLSDIPLNYFNILGLDAIVDGKFESNLLVDIMGGVTEITQSQIIADNNKSKVVFTLTDLRENLLCNFINIIRIIRMTEILLFYLLMQGLRNLKETTCVTVAKLEKFECGQSGWYYDGCVGCTKSVTLKDGKLTCYSKHVSVEAVTRFKLEVLASDGKFKYKFIFWDVDCVKLIGKSALQIKMDLIEFEDYDPLEFPYELDAILQKELAIRVVFQPNKARLYVVSFKDDEYTRQKIKDSFRFEEHTSKLQTPDLSSHDELLTISENLSASADYDPAVPIRGLTPSKRSLSDATDEFESVQLSLTKLTKDIKMEKWLLLFIRHVYPFLI